MKIPEKRHMDCRLPIADCGEAVPALRPAGILPAAVNKGKMPSPRHKSQISNRKFENGFVLVLVIMVVAIIGIEMFTLTGIANRMQFQSQRAYLRACERNLLASGLAWARRNIPDKTGESSTKSIQLDVSEMNIRAAALDVTIRVGPEKEADVLVNTSCSRGRQTFRGGGTYRIGLYDKQETAPGARQDPAGD